MAKAKRPFHVQQPQVKDPTMHSDETPSEEIGSVEEVPTEAVTEAPSEVPSEVPTEAVTEAPSEEPVAEAARETVVTEQATEAPTEAPVEAADVQTADVSLSEEEQYLLDIEANGTALQKGILQAAKRFIAQTKPRMPITEQAGYKAQSEFLDWMLKVLDADPEEMRKGWNALLVFFKVFHGDDNSPRGYSALSEYRAACFREQWTDGDRLTAYTNLITTLRFTRNIKTRKHDVKRIDLSVISPEIMNEHRLGNLKRFYGV